jgi:hypothetical protein
MISFNELIIIAFCFFIGLRFGPFKKSETQKIYLNAALFYWAVLIGFFWPAVVHGKFMVPGDIFNAFYPWKGALNGAPTHNPLLSDIVKCVYPWMGSIQKSFHQFEFALWNPYSYAGAPLAGNQVSAAFHPFGMFYFIMPLPDAATLFPFLRVFIAAMGTFALLRSSWGLSVMPALLGGTLFSFCGVHISWLSNYPEVSVTMLLPWILLSLDKIALKGGMSWWILLVQLSTIQFMGGHCESSFHLYAWAIPYFSFRLNRERVQGRMTGKEMAGRAFMLVSAGVFSLGQSGLQLLPFLEYLPLTTRMQEITASGQSLFLNLDFVRVITSISATLITPDFFGNPVDSNYWGYFNYIEPNTHITITGFFLSLISLTRKSADPEKEYIKRLLVCGGLLAFLIAARTPGLFEFVVSLPLFKQNSNHRLIFIFSFAFSMLAAFEAHKLQHHGPSSKKTIFIISAGILGIALFLHQFSRADLNSQQTGYRMDHLQWAFVFLSVAVGALVFLSGERRRKTCIPVLLALVLVEVFTWGRDFNPFISGDDLYPSTPLIDFIKSKPGTFRVAAYRNTLPEGSEMMFEYDAISGLDPMKTYTYERIHSRISGKHDSIITAPITRFDSPWLNFLNVRYVAAPPGMTNRALGNPQLILVYSGKDGVVFENPKAFDRIFRVESFAWAENDDQAFELAVQHEQHLDQVAVVSGYMRERDNLNPDKVTGIGNVPKLIEREKASLTFDFQGTAGGFYVISQQYYPGWKLEIDGHAHDIVRANYAFTGFWVPEGAKQVRLYYDPVTFRAGLWMSAIFSLSLLLLFLYQINQKRWCFRFNGTD